MNRDATGKIGFYRPIIYPNEFWHLRSSAYPINETVRYEKKKREKWIQFLKRKNLVI